MLYSAFGLGIRSELPFPELVAVEQASDDVVIRQRKLNSSERRVSQKSAFFLGETANVGTFLVQDGHEILIDPVQGVDEALLRTIVLGPILAVLLRQRGLAVLHASGIGTDRGAVAFLGASGWGKSTLAEAFYNRGYGVVTDDVMAVRIEDISPQVFPAYPSVKLFPDTASFLGCDASATHLVHSQTEKRVHYTGSRFPQSPLPLQRIYVLAVGEGNEIEPLQPQAAFVELVRNSRTVSLLRDVDSLNVHLRQCTRLATEVSVFRLKRRPVLADLPEVVQLIEDDLAKNSC